MCLDGTGNKPKAGVGTFAAAGAWTRLARFISRTARALAGMLYWVGAFRPGADNLVSYAVSAYAFRAEPKPGRTPDSDKTAKKFKPLNHMSEVYAQPVDTQGHKSVPIEYLGVWDTVRAGGLMPLPREFRRGTLS